MLVNGRRHRSLTLAVLMAFALAGCARGCLSTWLEEHAFVPARPANANKPKGIAQLRSVDCADGLARCVGGVVEVSRLSSHPDPCSGPREACECPWDRLEACSQGCVAEDVEVVLPRERAQAQLCAPDPGAAYSLPVRGRSADTSDPSASADEETCGDDRYACAASAILSCEPSPHVVARCLKGCAVEGVSLEDDSVTEAVAVALLCAR
jgi:hypothetical protein